MAKIATLAFMFAAIVVAQGFPASDSDISEAASKGDWDAVHKLISQQFNDPDIFKFPSSDQFPSFPPSFGSVRSLKSPPGGHVFGKSEYSFRTSSNVNGKTSENSGGHRIVNNDGKIEESDFQPTF